jgi:oligopeptide/dipeptide ABC transporter ATP-binding protein
VTTVLEVRDLRTYMYTRRGVLKAVDGVSFDLDDGETLGIVGESGCGKSTLALSLMRLVPHPPARIVGGSIRLDGEDLLAIKEARMREVRGGRISMILQDPQASLNPVFNIGNQVTDVIGAHTPSALAKIESLWRRALAALRRVGIPEAERRMRAFPHQLSGGMKQRVVGAMTLWGGPRVLIADEPTTALDATIQAQYLRLLKDLQAASGTAIVFITHDLGVVARMCDRVAVMYAGRLVEQAAVREIFRQPRHPYTRALLASVPRMAGPIDGLRPIDGQPPALSDLPPGCHFAPRCPLADERCRAEYPPVVEFPAVHTVACWHADSVVVAQ